MELSTTDESENDASNTHCDDDAVAVAVQVNDSDAAEAVATIVDTNDQDDKHNEIPQAVAKILSQQPSAKGGPTYNQEVTALHLPSIISATVLKKNDEKSNDIGITFEKKKGSLRISSIDSNGLFGDSPIRVGDVVLSVNNKSCDERNERYVERLLRRAKESITMVVSRQDGDPYIVSTMVTKASAESKVGIGVQRVDGSLCVSSIDPNGLFADSVLNIGDKVASIGGVPCACMDSTSAVELIRNEEKTVTIVTWTERAAGVVLATRNVSLASSILSLLRLWRRNIMIISFTFALVAIIAVIVSQTGHKTACEDRGQRPLPVERECP